MFNNYDLTFNKEKLEEELRNEMRNEIIRKDNFLT